jgi:small-conductance mechanosensitive channel
MGSESGTAREEQTAALKQLEKAAEKSADPATIDREASRQPERLPSPAWIIPYVFAGLAIGAVLLLLEWNVLPISQTTLARLHRYVLGAFAVAGVLTVSKGIEVYAISRLHNAVARYNLQRVLRLLVVAVCALILISVLFVNWYAAVVSLGLISLVLGFALQTPISSFIGWVYILLRAPFRVGDRIEISDLRGDVIDVSYLDTTVWEIGGRHLSTDHPSGRLIKFPNSNVLSGAVINYSWPLFPYIWNEIKVNVAYESDLEFVSSTMKRLAEEEVGEMMMEKVKVFRELLAKTPIDHLDVSEKPAVVFRVSDNTWIEAIVQYLVHPKEAGRVRTRLTRKILEALNASPDRVLFPKSNNR